MSFKTSSIRLPSATVLETADKYFQLSVMDRFILKESGGDFIKNLCANTKDLRIYGGPNDVKAELIAFRDFSSNYRHFKIRDSEPCYVNPILYKSIKNNEYMTKIDVLIVLENKVIDVNQWIMNSDLVYKISIMYLRQHEKTIDGHLEFVNCNLEDIEKFIISDDPSDTDKNIGDGKSSHNTIKSFDDCITNICSFFVREKDQDDLRSLISKELTTSGKKKIEKANEIIETLEVLDDKIRSRPQWFTLDRELEDTMKSPAVVRLFEDNNQQFIMIPELIGVMKRAGIQIDPLMEEYHGSSDVIPTITFREAFNMIKREDLQKIEFVKTAVRRTKHTAIPIPTHDGSHCVLSVDALFDILYSLIRKQKIFQQSEHIDWPVIENLVNQVTSFFNGDGVSMFFIKNICLEEMLEDLNLAVSSLNLPRVQTYIRDIEPPGFSQKDLEQELNRIRINRCFRNIAEYAEKVFEKLMESRFEDCLMTSDMCKAVEKCQILCIFDRFPRDDPSVFIRDGTRLLSSNKFDPIGRSASRFNGKNQKNSKTEKSIGIRNSREPLRYSCNSLEELSKFSISFEKMFGEEASDDSFQEYISKQKEKRIIIRTLLFTMMDPIKNRRVLMEEIIYSIPFILKQQSIYTKENIEKLESLKEKYIKNRSDHLFVTIDLEELRMVLDDFNIDKKEITLIPDFMSLRFVYDTSLWKIHQNPVYINSSFGQLVSSNDIRFFLFEKFVCSYDWSPIFHCGHETPFKSCLCGLRDKLLQTFLELMETGNFYRPFSHYETYSKQITQYIDENSIKLSFSSFVNLKGNEFSDTISLRILLDDKICGLKKELFRSDKQREEARKLQIETWQMKTILMISTGTVFFKRKYLHIYDIILKGIAYKIPHMNFCHQEGLELYVVHGNQMPPEKDQKKLEVWLETMINNQKLPLESVVLYDTFNYIKHEEFLKNIENKKRFSTGGLENQNKQKKVIPEKSEVPSSSIEEKHEEIGTTENEKPETSVKKQVETPKKKKTVKEEPKREKSIETKEKQVDWCSKCFRTSEYCKEMKEKCSFWKGKAKEFEKQMSVLKKELDEKKEKEEKMEDIIKKKFDDQMEELKKKVEKETLESSKVLVGMIRNDNER
uniref:RING-type domain-containing protein n=1 Tax=Caenorhabditis tropicalis TaxID=1561998 RepID=A0A1I7TYR4_9PELO